MTKTELIQQATINARNSWVDYHLAQEKEIYQVFNQTANEIAKRIERYSVQGKMVPGRLKLLLGNIKDEMDRLRPRLMGKLKTGMRQSIDYGIKSGIEGVRGVLPDRYKLGIGSSFIGKDGKMRRFDAKIEKYQDSMWAKINGDALDFLARYSPLGITLSDRIWDISWQAEKAIRNRIQMGILSGESASKLSRDIRGFLGEPERLYRRVRKGGRLMLSKPAAVYHPGMGVSRSSYKNAIRLVRTEYARAYTEGTYRYGAQKTWIKGYIFRTASGNPCPMCADLDGVYFPKENPPPIPVHPNCFCYAEIVTDEVKIK